MTHRWASRIEPEAAVLANFAEQPRKELLSEVASIARDPVNPSYGGMLMSDDATLATRGNGKGLRLYDEVRRDSHARAVLDKRARAPLAREWTVDPGGPKRVDRQAAEFVRQLLAELEIDQLCLDLADAQLKGFAVAEINWGLRGGLLVPQALSAKRPERFGFNEDRQLRLLDDGSHQGVAVPERKFIVHTHGARYGSPYGEPLGSALWWLTWFKRQDLAFWLTFAERFAAPTVVGAYEIGTSEPERRKLLRIAQAVGRDAAAVLPKNLEIKLLEAARSGGSDVYERLGRYLDEQISEVVLGETLSTNASQGGSYAAANTHNEVREELAKADADLMSGTVNKTLVRWAAELNFPGAALPKFWRNFSEPEDLAKRAETDGKVFNLGFEPSEAYIQETYGQGWAKRPTAAPVQAAEGAAQPGPSAPPPSPGEPEASFAEGEPDDLVDLFAERGAREGAGIVAGWLERLRELTATAPSLMALRDNLGGMFAKLPTAELATSLRNASLAAHLAGQSEVKDGR